MISNRHWLENLIKLERKKNTRKLEKKKLTHTYPLSLRKMI